MKEKFGEELLLEIYTNDSEEAKSYTIFASTTVFINDEWVPVDVALSKSKMEDYISQRL